MANYWEKRAARQMYLQMASAEDFAKDMAKYYISASRSLFKESQNIIGRLSLQNNISVQEAELLLKNVKDPTDLKRILAKLKLDPKNASLVSEIEAKAARIARLDALHDQVRSAVGAIQVTLNRKAQKLFVNLAKNAYYHAIYDAQQYAGYGYTVKMLDEKLIQKAMQTQWDGSGFSKRLWGNTQDLERAVKRELMVNLLTGRPPIKASQAIDTEFAKGYNNARRLIRTESSFITNRMKMEGYKALGTEKYIYVAILDLRTSKVCRELDKKRFLVSSAKVGVNYPPMHPWCRSTTMPWISDILLRQIKQRAFDPKTGKHVLVPGDMTYSEWFKKFVKEAK